MSPVNTYANDDVSTYANPITVTNKKFTNILTFGTSGSKGVVTLEVNMKLYTDSVGTTMKYSSVACTPGLNTTTTSASVYGVDVYYNYNYTSNFDDGYMYIDFYIETVVNSTTYYTVYRFNYYKNEINTHYIKKSPSTTRYIVADN